MAFVKPENTGRKNLGDVILQVETINEEAQSVTGFDMRTGEELTVSLAQADEIAKYFSGRNDNRPYEERVEAAHSRVKRRPDILIDGKVEEGSVVRFENTRSYPVDGGVKTVAMWPEALARDPDREAVVVASVEANIRNDGKPFLKLYDDTNPKALADIDLDAAFNGDFMGLPMATSGIVVTVRDENNSMITSSLFTDFRSKADPSIESALNSGNGIDKFEVMAAAVVAAATGREFDDLKLSTRLHENDVQNARGVFDDIRDGIGKYEVMVVPAATVQFIPTHAEPDFLKDFHGTHDGKPDPKISPDPAVTYNGKGVTPSVVSVSLHPSDPDAPVSVRKLQPVNGYEFTNQPERKIYMAMEEVMAERFGASKGAEQQQARNLGNDMSPFQQHEQKMAAGYIERKEEIQQRSSEAQRNLASNGPSMG